jgi:hypothetical protein
MGEVYRARLLGEAFAERASKWCSRECRAPASYEASLS